MYFLFKNINQFNYNQFLNKFNKLYLNKRLIQTSVYLLRKTHYDILGVDMNASQSEIKNAYFEKSKLYHPDRNLTDTGLDKIKTEKLFLAVQKAYELLSNPDLKEEYDKKMFGRVSSNYERKIPEQDIFETKTNFYKTYKRTPQPKRTKQERHELVIRSNVFNTFSHRRDTHEFYEKLNEERSLKAKYDFYTPIAIILFATFIIAVILL